MKGESFHYEKYNVHQEAKPSLFEFNEVFDNRQRRPLTLGFRSRAEFEESLFSSPPRTRFVGKVTFPPWALGQTRRSFGRYNELMARRPSYRHGIKRADICDWPEGVGTPEVVAARVTYTGSPKHKTYQSPAGAPAQRADAAKCARFSEANWPRLGVALRMAIREGCVSSFRGAFPYRAWVWINDVLHEARLTNKDVGDYHGFPIDDPRQYPEPADRLEAAPRVEIPVV